MARDDAPASMLNALMREIEDVASAFERTPVRDVRARRRLEREVLRLRMRYTRLARRHAHALSLLRTCRACGATWTVDPGSAMRLQDAANAAGRRLVGRRDRKRDLARIGRALDAFNACPMCGATTFDERWD